MNTLCQANVEEGGGGGKGEKEGPVWLPREGPVSRQTAAERKWNQLRGPSPANDLHGYLTYKKNLPPKDPTVGLCLGSSGGS